MLEAIKIAMLGMDTSHCLEFTKRIQDPDCPYQQFVDGMRVTSCLRFATPFANETVLNERQAQLEKWKVKVTTNFDEAMADCDAIMIEINDPALHLDYIKKCVEFGKPIFLDKPLADTFENGRAILNLAKEKSCKIFCASALRFAPALRKVHAAIPYPSSCVVYGALGKAPSGSSIIWYGVHAFEMLQLAIGSGATSVTSRKDQQGAVILVDYPDARRGIVELTHGMWNYGGYIMNSNQSLPFVIDSSTIYVNLLREVKKYFSGTPAPLSLYYDTLHIMAMLEAAERSYQSGQPEKVPTL
jgi:hypothetical protein